VKMGVMCEPPRGVPAMPPILEALAALDVELFAIVEQDMYPCPPDQPLPVARRTHTYLTGCGPLR
jgi:inosose dehydratase